VIDYAHEEAEQLNHKYVGTEHLLLGLIREEEGVAVQVLMNLGLHPETVRVEILRLLGHIPENPPAPHIIAERTPSTPNSPAPPRPITNVQLCILRDLIERIQIDKENAVIAQDFQQAAHHRDEEESLKRLIACYKWYRDHFTR
jgi:ATP-dependent Clp protease ATP-binding subunit ClpC